jgi:hypothetical protein
MSRLNSHGDVRAAIRPIRIAARHQWREGDVALLEAVAARLGVQVPEPPQLFDANRM